MEGTGTSADSGGMMEFMSRLPTQLSCVSYEPKQGDPFYNWEDIKSPKLRRYSESLLGWTWQAYLGSGIDGVALKAMTVDGVLVVAKIFFSNARPTAPAGMDSYWPFERECRNSAMLEMIMASLRDASASEIPVLVNPQPVTRRHVLENLRQFSADRSTHQTPSHFRPIKLDTQINPCLGWTAIRGKDANKVILALGEMPLFDDNNTFPVIIYPYIPKEELRVSTIQTQLDFFYRLGFICTPVEARNWRGQGVLVDFSDLISPHAPEWEEFRFGRLVRSNIGLYYLERRILKIKQSV